MQSVGAPYRPLFCLRARPSRAQQPAVRASAGLPLRLPGRRYAPVLLAWRRASALPGRRSVSVRAAAPGAGGAPSGLNPNSPATGPGAAGGPGAAAGGAGAGGSGKPWLSVDLAKGLVEKLFEEKPETEGFVTYSQFLGYMEALLLIEEEMSIQRLLLYDHGKTGIIEVAGLDDASSQLFAVTFPGDAAPEIIRLVRRSAEALREPRKALQGQVRCDLTLVDSAASYPPVIGQTIVYVIPILGFWAFQKLVDLFAAFKGIGRFKKSAAKAAAEEFGRSRARRIDAGGAAEEASGRRGAAGPSGAAPPAAAAEGAEGASAAAATAAVAAKPPALGVPGAIRFADIAGVDSAVDEFKEIINIMLGDPTYLEAGVKCPRGVLLEGPPGTGKTMLATAVANEAGLPFYSASGSEFVQMFSGVAAARVRDLFRKARQTAPSIIFIDEIDALGRARSEGAGDAGTAEREQGLLQLLVEMDGFNSTGSQVLVIGATNVKHVLDQALLRPGRFDRVIPMGLPSRQSRLRILQVHARNKQLPAKGSAQYPDGGEALLRWAADSTSGMSGADLENLLNEAAILSVRNETPTIGQAEIEVAMDKMRLGVAQPLLPPSDSKRQLALIEAARGVMATLHARLCPVVLQVSVRPRGSKISRTVVVEALEAGAGSDGGAGAGASNRLIVWEDCVDMLAITLAGRAAEMVVYGPAGVSLNTATDLAAAEKFAVTLVARTGLHPEFRLLPLAPEEAPQYPWRREALEGEVRALMAQAFYRATSALTVHRPALEAIAEELVIKDTVFGSRLRQIVAEAPRNPPPAGPEPPQADVAGGFREALERADQLVSYADLDWEYDAELWAEDIAEARAAAARAGGAGANGRNGHSGELDAEALEASVSSRAGLVGVPSFGGPNGSAAAARGGGAASGSALNAAAPEGARAGVLLPRALRRSGLAKAAWGALWGGFGGWDRR